METAKNQLLDMNQTMSDRTYKRYGVALSNFPDTQLEDLVKFIKSTIANRRQVRLINRKEEIKQ